MRMPVRSPHAKKPLYALTGAFAALALASFSSCEVSVGGSFADSIREAVTSPWVFYAENPGDTESPVSISERFQIGETVQFSSLTFDSLRIHGSGYTFKGWHYYQNPETQTTDVPATVELDTDEYVLSATVTPSPAAFYGVWEIDYDNYGEITVIVLSDDVSVSTATSGTEVTVTCESGYDRYSWLIDGKNAEEALTGASVSASGEVLSIPAASLERGYVYQITVAAQKGTVIYSAQLQVEAGS
ncbi:MAG: hypothetical protein K6G80_03915 [Treponema sp.]|nr:hypothetical protein [Treponema sp.]